MWATIGNGIAKFFAAVLPLLLAYRAGKKDAHVEAVEADKAVLEKQRDAALRAASRPDDTVDRLRGGSF
jgi:hypothetical protein